jgi:hypothetical protein
MLWYSAQKRLLSHLSQAVTVLYLYFYFLCRKGTKLKLPQGVENAFSENGKKLEGWEKNTILGSIMIGTG